mgnify:CR=1 FL=1
MFNKTKKELLCLILVLESISYIILLVYKKGKYLRGFIMKEKDILNNKGFTLIELLITIVILVMLTVLATPNVIKLVEKNNRDNYNSTIDSVISSAKIYASTNKYSMFDETDINGKVISCSTSGVSSLEKFVSISNLDINGDIINSCTKKNIDKEKCGVVVTYSCDKKVFSYKVSCGSYMEDGKYFKVDNSNIYTDEVGKIRDGYYCDDLF